MYALCVQNPGAPSAPHFDSFTSYGLDALAIICCDAVLDFLDMKLSKSGAEGAPGFNRPDVELRWPS